MFKTNMATALGAIMVAASASALALSPAQAADLGDGSLKDTGPVYAAPAPLWTGFYLGVHGGYADGEWDGTLGLDTTDDPAAIGYDNLDKTIDGDGFFGGGQIGYNFQRGNLVLGIEADASFADVDGSETYTTVIFGGCCSFSKDHQFEVEYFGTLRGRLGYAEGRYLAYVTGGFAWAKVDGSLTVTANPVSASSYVELDGASDDNTHTGWTLGGGVEAALSDRWSLKAEYLYIDLSEEDYAFAGTKVDANGNTVTGKPVDEFNDVSLDMHTFKIGLNYRFGSFRETMEPLK